KTTHGLVSLQGVFPLSPGHLDTVGPMAKDIPRLVQGMDLLQEGFAAKYRRAVAADPIARSIKIGRFYVAGTDPRINRAIDAILRDRGFRVVVLPDSFQKEWDQAQHSGETLAASDIWKHHRKYLDRKGL